MEGARPVLDIPPLAQSRRSISSANPSITFLSCLLVSELISSLKFADMDSQLYRLQLHHNCLVLRQGCLVIVRQERIVVSQDRFHGAGVWRRRLPSLSGVGLDD
jgi:hypothetical protein